QYMWLRLLAQRPQSSPLEGEVPAKRAEGVAAEGTATASSTAARTPPGRALPGHPPFKGEGNPRSATVNICC
ncbi:MAG: hypothetical protein E5X58_47965, partial [Mesorhizobium sp.]